MLGRRKTKQPVCALLNFLMIWASGRSQRRLASSRRYGSLSMPAFHRRGPRASKWNGAEKGLVEDKADAVQPATLVSPRDGRVRPPLPGQGFGDFRWNPSQSEGVMEIVEFDYGRASRLFVTREGSVSAGRLWTTGGLWFWRVWSVGKDGQVVLSDTWQFAH
jgi:hypothetical protein